MAKKVNIKIHLIREKDGDSHGINITGDPSPFEIVGLLNHYKNLFEVRILNDGIPEKEAPNV